MRREVLLLGNDLSAMADVSLQLDPSTHAATLAQTPRPLDYLLQAPRPSVSVVILWLNGRENVADLRAVLAAHPQATFVLLLRHFPPRPAVSRVVAEHCAAALRENESAVVIIATLLALQFQREAAS